MHTICRLPLDTFNLHKKRPLSYALANKRYGAAIELCSLGARCNEQDLECIITRDWDEVLTLALKENTTNEQLCCDSLEQLLRVAVSCCAKRSLTILTNLLKIHHRHSAWSMRYRAEILVLARSIEDQCRRERRSDYSKAEYIARYLEKFFAPAELKTPVLKQRATDVKNPIHLVAHGSLDVSSLRTALPSVPSGRPAERPGRTSAAAGRANKQAPRARPGGKKELKFPVAKRASATPKRK